jgi:hypothetical protein
METRDFRVSHKPRATAKAADARAADGRPVVALFATLVILAAAVFVATAAQAATGEGSTDIVTAAIGSR